MIKIGPLHFRKGHVAAMAEETVEEPTEMTRADGSTVTVTRRAVRYFPVMGRPGAVRIPEEYDVAESARKAGMIQLGDDMFVDPKSVVMAVFDEGRSESGEKLYGFQVVLETGQPIQGPCTEKQERKFLKAWKECQ